MSLNTNDEVTENIDIAFVIDTSGEMAQYKGVIKETVEATIDKIKELRWNYININSSLRAKLIAFSDYLTEGEDAIRQTDFFRLPEERKTFNAALSGLRFEGGGKGAENGLEALYAAMISDWRSLKNNEMFARSRGFHVIFVITNSYPLKLGERSGCTGYPTDQIPSSVIELEELWNEYANIGQEKSTKLDDRRKLLFMLAPEGQDESGHSWEEVFGWQNVTCTPLGNNFDLEIFDLVGFLSEFGRYEDI